MSAVDLSKMNHQELVQLQRDVATAITSSEDKRRKDAAEKIKQIASESGYSIEDLLSKSATKTSKPKAAAKFRNPENPSETWTGKGRKPGWFNAAMDAGRPEEDLLINA